MVCLTATQLSYYRVNHDDEVRRKRSSRKITAQTTASVGGLAATLGMVRAGVSKESEPLYSHTLAASQSSLRYPVGSPFSSSRGIVSGINASLGLNMATGAMKGIIPLKDVLSVGPAASRDQALFDVVTTRKTYVFLASR